MNLSISRFRVQEAMELYPEARKVLETMFPEAILEPKPVSLLVGGPRKLSDRDVDLQTRTGIDIIPQIELAKGVIRSNDDLRNGRALYFNGLEIKWKIEHIDMNSLLVYGMPK